MADYGYIRIVAYSLYLLFGCAGRPVILLPGHWS